MPIAIFGCLFFLWSIIADHKVMMLVIGTTSIITWMHQFNLIYDKLSKMMI